MARILSRGLTLFNNIVRMISGQRARNVHNKPSTTSMTATRIEPKHDLEIGPC